MQNVLLDTFIVNSKDKITIRQLNVFVINPITIYCPHNGKTRVKSLPALPASLLTCVWSFCRHWIKGLMHAAENSFIYCFMFDHVLNIWPIGMILLTLASVIFIKYLFFHQMVAFQKLWKMLFISSKKLFSFSRYSNFCDFFPSLPNFPDIKGEMKVE